jgi:hypothetical protein
MMLKQKDKLKGQKYLPFILISKYNIHDQISVYIYSTHTWIYYSSISLYRFRKLNRTDKIVRQIIARIKNPIMIKETIAAVRHLVNAACVFNNSSRELSGVVVSGGVVVNGSCVSVVGEILVVAVVSDGIIRVAVVSDVIIRVAVVGDGTGVVAVVSDVIIRVAVVGDGTAVVAVVVSGIVVVGGIVVSDIVVIGGIVVSGIVVVGGIVVIVVVVVKSTTRRTDSFF